MFRLKRPFHNDFDPLRSHRSSFEEDEVEEAFEYSVRLARREKHSGIYAARVILLVYDGKPDAARELLDRHERNRNVHPFHVEQVRGAIERAQSGELRTPPA